MTEVWTKVCGFAKDWAWKHPVLAVALMVACLAYVSYNVGHAIGLFVGYLTI